LRKLRDLNGRFRVNRKAVSPVIATLLMIAIAVAAAILVYVWSMGLIGGLQTGGGQQVREQIMMDEYTWTTAGAVTGIVRNVGNAKVEIAAVYVEGHSATFTPNPSTMDPLSTSTLSITAISGFTPVSGVAYTLKIVTKTGGVFSYSITFGHGG
jgi:flagellin-like protein